MIQGTVPLFPRDYIEQKLTESQLTLLDLALKREAPQTPEVQADIDTILDTLELTSVWGKRPDGYAQVRAFLVDDEHLFVQCRTFTWDDLDVPADVRTRKFLWADSPDALFVKLLAEGEAYRRIVGGTLTLLPEDHPEMDAVGYRVVDTNETWLVKRDAVKIAVNGSATGHPEALVMFRTASGRRTLAKHLQDGTLTNIMTQGRTVDTTQGRAAVRRAEQSLQTETQAAKLARNFLKRGK